MPDKPVSSNQREHLKGVGITILIILVSSLIVPAILALPAPVFLYRLKLGRRSGCIIAGMVTVLLFIMSGGISPDVIFISCQLTLALIMAELFERGVPVDKTVVYSCGSVLLGGGVLTAAITAISGTNPFSVLATQFAQILTQLKGANVGMNFSAEAVTNVSEFMANYLPAGLMVTLFSSACVTMMIFRNYAKRKGEMISVSFKDWKSPDFLVWCFIGAALLQLLPAEGAKIISNNLMVIFMVVYLLQGLMVVSYFFEKFKFPRFLKIVFFIGIAVQNFALIGAVALGLFDMWFNFRKLGTEQKK